MVSSNPMEEASNKDCKHDVQCGNAARNHCLGCGQMYCMDHYLEHHQKLQKHVEHLLRTQGLLSGKLKSLILQLPANVKFDLIEQIHECKRKSNEIKKTANIIQRQLQELFNEDIQGLKKQSMTMTNGLEPDQNGYLENDIERLKKDTEQLKLQLEEVNDHSQKRVSQERLQTDDIHVQSDNLPETMKSPPSDLVSWNKRSNVQSIVDTITDLNESELDPTEKEEEEEEEEEMIGVIDSSRTPRISRKIRLSNHFVSRLRGHFKIMIDAPMYLVELCTRDTHASDAVVQAVKQGLGRQNQIAIEQQTIKPAFAEITPGWTYEGKNTDRGFSSVSIWMRDPEGRRILVKTQDHPLSAANEWLAYALGRRIDLPVNEVQIAIYQNNLVTLHTDVSHETEKTFTFMDLPKKIRKTLLTNPIMECMDLFDFIIQNVDRNPRNILITISNTTAVDENIAEMKVHLIDHSACFGMGKLNVVSVMASKFHSQHLTVVKFDPKDKARKFEQYLSKLPIADRIFIGKTLNGFATITDAQFDSWMTEIQDLLSASQCNRIRDVLYRQRDIARDYMIQCGISSKSSSVKLNETNQCTTEMTDIMTYL